MLLTAQTLTFWALGNLKYMAMTHLKTSLIAADSWVKIMTWMSCFLQSNHEGQIVTWIQEAINKVDAIVLNAGAYTHTSIAIHDALRAYTGFVIELHISNPHLRESFRHLSYVSSAANAVIAGLGVQGYERSIEIIAQLRDQTTILESH